jgi:D-sedoheptulose 7-phosphate isomerase
MAGMLDIFQEIAKLSAWMVEDNFLHEKINIGAQTCIDALNQGNKIMFAGNGGSAADAQHLAGELVSRFEFDRPGLAGMALTTDTSILTAVGNDYGYEQIFERQIYALGRPGDVLIAFSTSGKSKNILRSLQAAKQVGISAVGFVGSSKEHFEANCQLVISVPSTSTPRIQECHIKIGHVLCGLIESAIFKN